jgi:hypothetical protein
MLKDALSSSIEFNVKLNAPQVYIFRERLKQKISDDQFSKDCLDILLKG